MYDVKTHITKNSDGTLTIGTTQDVQGVLDQNKIESNGNLNRSSKDTYGRKIASIPLNVLNLWCKEWGCNMYQLSNDPMLKAKMFSKLRDTSYSKLRTDTGKI